MEDVDGCFNFLSGIGLENIGVDGNGNRNEHYDDSSVWSFNFGH